ncbi:hypothetical protein [Pseudonocardia asaccharolytica]|uniref:MalT-like TPR region domain-containing protein n=1 Tax=Pseudonocardia asaccharolytica DSM 44247 = NBRC 16224 TaxID=1123024 RepID=A0A511D6Z4_9PSEU|nr:hypothetical protein [Pseudonocardia asaccharolytica]GEL20566.1 hypothetical protein PA7_44030 [Pseudonocardia asaccharolytica DSM 44247 = NBRC 16224]
MLSWGAYVAGEIESSAGRREPAERHYLWAIDLARTSGATFLIGVATVGLLRVRAGAGRVHDALRGYRDMIDYFARTGNWTHLWVTLRNLADLLRRLGDNEPAARLVAAADRAPDAPADGLRGAAPSPPVVPGPPAPSRATVLEVARLGHRAEPEAIRTALTPVLRRTTCHRPKRCSTRRPWRR